MNDEDVVESNDTESTPEPVETPPLTYAAPTIEATPKWTRGDGSDATKPIVAPGHHGLHPGRHTDQYP